MKKTLALMLCAALSIGGCISPSIAMENNESSVSQSENERRAQYISTYFLDVPAGSVDDYEDDETITSGSIEWDEKAVDASFNVFLSLVIIPLNPAVGIGVSIFNTVAINVQNFVVEYAPDTDNCTYVMKTYRNDEISVATSEYYMHEITYTFEVLGEELTHTETVFETRSFVS